MRQGPAECDPGHGDDGRPAAAGFYVFAVIATELFGRTFVDWFRTLGASMYTLFQIMRLESWSRASCGR